MVVWPLPPQTPGPLFVQRRVPDRGSAVRFGEGGSFSSSLFVSDLAHVCQINYHLKKEGRNKGREEGREGKRKKYNLSLLSSRSGLARRFYFLC